MDEHVRVGQDDDNSAMTLDDMMAAVGDTWDDEVATPPHVSQGVIQDVVNVTANANRSAGRHMGYGATLAWGISIGVHAERNRLKRIVRS